MGNNYGGARSRIVKTMIVLLITKIGNKLVGVFQDAMLFHL